jgi:predicted CoA-binding protein
VAFENPPPAELRRILTDSTTIAVVGASSRPGRPSNAIFKKLLAVGYRAIPVNPNESEVEGQKAHPTLEAVPVPIDIVDVFRRAEETPPIAASAAAVHAKVLWLQQGIFHEGAAARAQAGGLEVVMDLCIAVEHAMLRIPSKPRSG